MCMMPMPFEAPSISITAGIKGASFGPRLEASQLTWTMLKVLTIPVSPTKTHSSDGRKQSSQNMRGGIMILLHEWHARPMMRPFLSSARYLPIATPSSHA